MKYSTKKKFRTRVALAVLAVILAAGGFMLERGTTAKAAEGRLATCWTMCKPGAQVNVRRKPSRSSMTEGFLEAGDEMQTDGTSRDGWIRVYGIGEDGAGWLTNGENVQVFYMADGWAVTSRGYIRSEWLEADPR